MRNCPVCANARRLVVQTPYEKGLSLFCCANCDMLYLDKEDMTERKLNDYYKKEYQTDDHLFPQDRLDALADFVANWSTDLSIMDIGGQDRVLRSKLVDRGFGDMRVSGPGEFIAPLYYDIFILSHTLEHVYNTHGLLEKIKYGLKDDGLAIVEVPIWAADSPYTYDRHWQHINKFKPIDLMRLFASHDFEIISSDPLPPYREYNCHRMVARYAR